MHIARVSTLYPPLIVGGAEKSVAEVAEASAAAGDRVSVITLHPEAHESVEERNGVTVHRLPIDNIYWPYDPQRRPAAHERMQWHLRDVWNRTAAKRVGRLLQSLKPDVVHTGVLAGFSVSVWSQVKALGIPLAHTLHDFALICRRSTLFDKKEICRSRCTKCRTLTGVNFLATRQIDHVISMSNAVLDIHRANRMFRTTGATVLADAIIGPALEHKARPTDDETLVFGFFGRVIPEKGLDVLLAATERLERQNWRLVIGGTGHPAYYNALKDSHPDPRIVWLGFTKPELFYPQVDVLIFPSIWIEPQGRTVIESYYYGCSAICADIGGIAELAKLGRRVALYDPQEPGDLARRMDAAMGDVATWRKGGFRDPEARSSVSAPSVVERHREIYRSLLARDPRR